MKPDGPTYSAEREYLLAGAGLPLTDAVVGADGRLYFTTGGRKTASSLWRVSCVGNDSVLEPSKVISHQDAFESIRKHDGGVLTGKIPNGQDELLVVASKPFDLSKTMEIPRFDVKKIRLSPILPIPGSLINRLNREELKDVPAYLMGKK